MKYKVLYGLGVLSVFLVLLKSSPEKVVTHTNTLANFEPVTTGQFDSEASSDVVVQVPEKWPEAEKIPSLAGTHIDGDLREDAAGNLIVDLSVKDFFDYFLSAIGERKEEAVMAELEFQIKARLGDQAARQAVALLHSYIQYQVHMTSMMQAPLSPYEQQDYRYYADVMSAAFAELKSLRREYFDPATVDAFFSFEETYGDFSVGMLMVEADSDMTQAQKDERIEQLRSQLPEEMKQAEVKAKQRTQNVEAVRGLYKDGVRDSAIVAEQLDGYFSVQEVDELFAFYARESQWDQKTQEYFKEKMQIQSSGLAELDAKLAIASLRESLFQASEINRLLSEEAIMRENNLNL